MTDTARHQATLALIRRRLGESLAPVHLQIADQSGRHAGHQGAAGGGGHFAIVIVSASFEGLNRVARHRAVYEALRSEMGSAVHALAIEALAPSEWNDGRA